MEVVREMGSISSEATLNGSISSEVKLSGQMTTSEGLSGQITSNRSISSANLRELGREYIPGDYGTYDYNELINKPSIEGVTLEGDKTFPQLKLDALTNLEIYMILREG